MPFLPSVIINKITWLLRLKLCFDLNASLIFSVLYGTNKISRAIDLLFDSNFFQCSLCDGKFIPFQLYWLIKGLSSVVLSGWFLISLWFNHHYFLDLLLLFYFFNHSGESTYDPPLFRLILLSLYSNKPTLSKNKLTSFHWFF